MDVESVVVYELVGGPGELNPRARFRQRLQFDTVCNATNARFGRRSSARSMTTPAG